MIHICPTVLAADARTYRIQMDEVTAFARRIHIDLSDGILAPTKLLGPKHLWWPEKTKVDLHVMYQNPLQHIDALLGLKPDLLIIHAEADGDFMELSDVIRRSKTKLGIALLPETPVAAITPALPRLDHVLIFSGNIGYFGGHADLRLLQKVQALRSLKPQLEIGWDGGVNDQNAAQLVEGGVNVLNAGGYIHGAADPAEAYQTLVECTKPEKGRNNARVAVA